MREYVKRIGTTHFPFLLSAPAFLWQFYFLLIPLGFIAFYSVIPNGMTSCAHGVTGEHFLQLCNVTYLKIIINSALLALLTAVLSLGIAFPVAYYLAMRARRWKNILLMFLILPSWTSFIIQVYSWFYLLQKHGLFSQCLYWLHITSEPVSLLNNYGATVLGMTYCFLPFMILPLYTVLEKMDKKMLEASSDLGASWFQTLRYVILPLSRSGIKVGMILVMVSAFGEFAIPDLMGGFKDMYVGRTIMEKFLMFRDWHAGAAMVMVSVCIPLLVALFSYGISLLVDAVLKRKKYEAL